MQLKPRRSPSGFLATAVWFLSSLAIIPVFELEFRTLASWYGPGFHGRKTASGEVFDQYKMTAASRTLPFGTRLMVQNLQNGKCCEVVINDRGPYVRGRGIDLSLEAARRIEMPGVAPVLCYNFVAEQNRTDKHITQRHHNDPIPRHHPRILLACRPSRSLFQHATTHSVQYVAYEGAQRTVFDSTSNRLNKYVRTYRG